VTELASRQCCATCGTEYPELDPRIVCGRCGGLLDVLHRTPDATGDALRALFDSRLGARRGRARSGVWRFQEIVLPGALASEIVSHPEGDTPLLERDAVSRWAGATRLLLKHEGHNPTGSFKDRGMTVALTQARRLGAAAVACASTGNTSSSLASYAALAGIPAVVLVPEGQVAMGKLAQTMAYGARTALVRGDFDDCLRIVREASEHLGFYLVNSVNPYRLEGQKTIILELLQQLDWEPPAWIVLPAGNLGNAAAFGSALRDARALGLIEAMPRLALVQASGAAPFVRSFETGFAERVRVRAETVASAIRIGDPASYDRAVRSVRETNGIVIDVPDADIMAAKRAIDGSGVGCEPASAASVAGVRRLVDDGIIGSDERVVAILTGHMLKDPQTLLDAARDSGSGPVSIDPTVDALAALLRDTRS
jgi:threonine synthase